MATISLQLFSVRDDCAQDFFGTIKGVAEMGYPSVEFAGYHGASAADLKACLDDCGLKVSGAHVGMGEFEPEKLEATLEFHKAIGCDNLIVPWIPEEKRSTEAAAKAACEELSALVEILKPHGMRTGFHVHDGDMKPLDGGKCAWDIIGENTPADFIMQYDTCNGKVGGGDPVKPILDWAGRGLSTHIKDHKDGASIALGEGDIPWAEVFQALREHSGAQWWVVEVETYYDRSPMDTAKVSLENLHRLLGS
jgi:sugar phosphate isomerase/epimerase